MAPWHKRIFHAHIFPRVAFSSGAVHRIVVVVDVEWWWRETGGNDSIHLLCTYVCFQVVSQPDTHFYTDWLADWLTVAWTQGAPRIRNARPNRGRTTFLGSVVCSSFFTLGWVVVFALVYYRLRGNFDGSSGWLIDAWWWKILQELLALAICCILCSFKQKLFYAIKCEWLCASDPVVY